METFVLVVYSKPVEGKEKEYNDWYSEQHLSDVLKINGFKSAQRFKLTDEHIEAKWKYLALYEFESTDPTNTLKELTARAGTSEMVISEAMDLSAYEISAWRSIKKIVLPKTQY